MGDIAKQINKTAPWILQAEIDKLKKQIVRLKAKNKRLKERTCKWTSYTIYNSKSTTGCGHIHQHPAQDYDTARHCIYCGGKRTDCNV